MPSTLSAPQAAPPPPSPPPALAPDTILDGTYQIGQLLAQGGIGEVYLATHRRLARNVAVKVLSQEYAVQEEWGTRFRREALILGQLRHPNIVDVLDFNVAPNGAPYLVMELVDGPDLEAALRAGRRFSPTEVLSIVRQVASALSVAHAAGVVHRDLKAENVVLCEAPGQPPVVKVIDFGISLWGAADRVTAEHTVFGTPEYMSPEQAQGLRDHVDARSDQFSLAVLAYRLLNHRPPFAGETPLAILFQIVHGTPAAFGPCEGWDGAPVESVIQRGLASERDDRYPSILAFADALERGLAEGGALSARVAPASAPLVTGQRGRATVKVRRSRAVPRLLAATAIAVCATLSTLTPPPGPRGGVHAAVGHGVSRVRETVSSGWALLASLQESVNERVNP